jgi:hypothetical protein
MASRPSARPLDDMAVVCCYFNPCGYRSRRENYRLFRRALEPCGLAVLTVELAIGEAPFDLADEGGEFLRLRGPDVLWQKERLLNVGIRELLGRGYRRIVWLDADVLFDDPEGWPHRVAVELERAMLCQVFGQVLVDQGPRLDPLIGVSAVRYLGATERMLHQARRLPSLRHPFGLPPGRSGFGWAARAELLESVELYDASVVGGGDWLIYAAAYAADRQRWSLARLLLETSSPPCPHCGRIAAAPRFVEHYGEWARRWSAAVDGRIGFADQTLRTLYHGDRRHRRYLDRRDILLRHDFDPARDLALEANGCWSWGSAKSDLHREVADYFLDRREDA